MWFAPRLVTPEAVADSVTALGFPCNVIVQEEEGVVEVSTVDYWRSVLYCTGGQYCTVLKVSTVL